MLRVTVPVDGSTDTTVVPDAIPNPATLLPTAMEEGDAIDETVVLELVVEPRLVMTVPAVTGELSVTAADVVEDTVNVNVTGNPDAADVAGVLSVTMPELVSTAVTVVLLAIPAPETELPMAIEEDDSTDVTNVLACETTPVVTVGDEVNVRVTEDAVAVAASLSVTAPEVVLTETTVVPEEIPVPDTVLPTTMDEAEEIEAVARVAVKALTDVLAVATTVVLTDTTVVPELIPVPDTDIPTLMPDDEPETVTADEPVVVVAVFVVDVVAEV